MSERAKKRVPDVCTKLRRKAHCVFGYTHEGFNVMYCGLRWGNALPAPTYKQKHCKHCTRELRKAGMSWRWYEIDQFKK